MSWFSCRDYSIRTSRRLDGELSTYDKCAHFFHHVICMACRRFYRQMRMMDNALKRIKNELDSNIDSEILMDTQDVEKASASSQDSALTSEARDRIRDALSKRHHHS